MSRSPADLTHILDLDPASSSCSRWRRTLRPVASVEAAAAVVVVAAAVAAWPPARSS